MSEKERKPLQCRIGRVGHILGRVAVVTISEHDTSNQQTHKNFI